MGQQVDSGASVPSSVRDAIDAWVHDVSHADGVRPFNDLGMRMLHGDRAGHFAWIIEDEQPPRGAPTGDLVGIGVVDPADGSAQLAVAPQRRRHGTGRTLAETLRSAGAATWWSFGTLPGAEALAHLLGLTPVRQLLRMTRSLVAHPPEPVTSVTGDQVVHLSRFTEADIDEFVAVNAAAFADHPEQGAMTAHDVRLSMAEPWFRADDLLLARDDAGTLLGYHWTKVEDDGPLTGEVYVLGVSPEFEGRGLGRLLLNAGLAHLRERGVDHVHLYVEAANDRVVRMYESASFGIELRDTAWAAPEEGLADDR